MRVVLATLQAQTNHTIDVLPQLGLAALRRLDFYFHPAREPDDASAASLGVLREAVWRCLRNLPEETYDELRLVVDPATLAVRRFTLPWHGQATPARGRLKTRLRAEQRQRLPHARDSPRHSGRDRLPDTLSGDLHVEL